MELRNLMTFTKIVELGSFSKAAEELSYSQSTVTIQIQQLEEELNTPLFDRIHKQISVTEKGRRFYVYAKQILLLVERAALVVDDSGELKGELRIAAFDSLLSSVLPSILLEYHKRYPKVKLIVKVASGVDHMKKLLSRNEADCGFILYDMVRRKDYMLAFSQQERVVFVASPDHPLRDKKNITLQELSKHEIILANAGAAYQEALEEQAERLNVTFSPYMEIWTSASLLDFIISGGGIGFLPYCQVHAAVEKKEVHLLSVPEADFPIWAQLLYHKDKFVSRQMEVFFTLVNELYPKEYTLSEPES